jgi:uncharacterized protein (TIRG00374 family)
VLHWLRRGASVLILLAVLDYFVLPQVAGTEAALRLLRTVNPWGAAAAIALEIASLVSYSLLTRSMLPDRRPSFSWLFRSDVAALGVSHLLPGGAATSGALRYRLLQQGGAPAGDAAVGIAVEGAASTLMLATLFWLALVVSIPVLGLHRGYVIAALIGAVLLAGILLALGLHSRQAAPAAEPLHALISRLPRRLQPRVQRTVSNAVVQLNQLLADRRTLTSSVLWAAANWVFDAASLWLFLTAYGHHINPVTLFVAYGIANLLGTLPISPGGLGIIEGVLVPSLVGFGTPRAVAVLAVVSWRLFEFWAPIPIGGVSYLSLRLQRWWAASRSSPGPRACPRSSRGRSRGDDPASAGNTEPDQDPSPVRGGTAGVLRAPGGSGSSG